MHNAPEAFGDPHSDVELMVVETVIPNHSEEMVRLRTTLDKMLLHVDFLSVSEEEFEERSPIPGTVERAAAREGRSSMTRTERAKILLRKAWRDER